MQENLQEASRFQDIDSKLEDAQRQSWEAVEAIAAAIRPGMRELEAIKTAQKILAERGCRKFWHKCHVRFGRGTTLSFEDDYADLELGSNDIFYIDIGPIWDGIEGDAGATFVTGSDPEYQRCQRDVKSIFLAVSDHWRSSGATGRQLYEFAAREAEKSGWVLAPSYVRGHRLSEFPHSFHSESSLGQLDFHPRRSRWVLEIHICDPAGHFGAFHEDVLS